MAPKYRLKYFNLRSLGEPIRWIFAYTGTEYEDDRIPTDFIAWFTQKKAEFASTVGQVPVLYEEGKRELSQSSVISRYLASQHGLVGDNDWNNARIDEVISLLFDLYDDVEKRVQAKATLLDPKFKLYYAKFSKILEEQEGSYILGNKLTHADFWLACLISFFDQPLTGDLPALLPPGLAPVTDSNLPIGLTEEFPLLKKHKEAVTSIPQIKEWLAKRPQTAL